MPWSTFGKNSPHNICLTTSGHLRGHQGQDAECRNQLTWTTIPWPLYARCPPSAGDELAINVYGVSLRIEMPSPGRAAPMTSGLGTVPILARALSLPDCKDDMRKVTRCLSYDHLRMQQVQDANIGALSWTSLRGDLAL